MQYSSEFKRLVIYKLLSQPGKSVRDLANEVGVSKSTLWDWRREVCRVAGRMPDSNDDGGKTERSIAEKLRLVARWQELAGPKQGEFLRREGVHEEEILEWLDAMEWAVMSSKERLASRAHARKLERKLRKAEKRLKESDALLELQKKVERMWGDDGGDGTPSSND